MLAKESRPRHVEPHPAERAVIAGDVLDRSSEELAAVIQHFQDENPCIKRVTRIRRAGPVASDPVDRLPAPGTRSPSISSRQLCMGTHDRRTLALANWIIWNLDGEGYLREDLCRARYHPGCWGRRARAGARGRAVARPSRSWSALASGVSLAPDAGTGRSRPGGDPAHRPVPEGAVREALRGPRPRALPAVRPRHAGAGRDPPPGAATGQTLRGRAGPDRAARGGDREGRRRLSGGPAR